MPNQIIDQLQPGIKDPPMQIDWNEFVLIPKVTLALIDPDQLIGCNSRTHAGITQKAKISEQVDDKTHHVAYADGNNAI